MSISYDKKKLLLYHKIYEHILEHPFSSMKSISHKIGVSRSIISLSIEEMKARKILIGPYLSINSAQNYSQYMHFIKFSDPEMIYQGLKSIPHLISHYHCFGDWNLLIITDIPLDFSHLAGFEDCIYRAKKINSVTLKAPFTSWEKAFAKMHSIRDHRQHENHPLLPAQSILPWGKAQWNLYHSFRKDVRITIAPVLKKLHIPYDTFKEWKTSLGDTCSILTEFYPEGANSYLNYLFLFKKCDDCMKEILACLPTTVTFIRVDGDDDLIASIKVANPGAIRELLGMFSNMKPTFFESLSSAVILKGCYHWL